MRRMLELSVLALLVAPVAGPRLLAQQSVIFGEEPTLDPMRKTLKADVLVLRDTLYAVDAVSARLVRAKVGGSPSVVLSSARSLQDECARAVRATTVMRGQMTDVGTNDARGKAVIKDYRKALDDLERSMQGCDKSLAAAIARPADADQEPLFRTALTAADAVKLYESKLHVLLKTLQIPVEPKGFRSAITM